MTQNKQSSARRLVLALSGLALTSCAVPPPSAYVGGSHAGEALDLGANAAHETCSVQRETNDAQIYCGSYLEPAGRVVTPEGAADPAAFLASSGWRSVFDGRFQCGNPAPATVLDSPAASLSCTRRQGGWPHVALAVRVNGTLYVADGVRPAESVLPTAIGVLSGKLPARPAADLSNGIATQRQAAQAVNMEGAGAISEVERQIGRGALENRRGNYAAAESAYRTAVAIQERLVGPNNPALAIPLAREALQVSNQGRFAEADRLFARAERLAALPDQIDPVARPLVAHLRALDQLNRNNPEEALALLGQAEAEFAAIVPPDALISRGRSAGARSAVEQMAQAAADSSLVADQSSSDALNGLIEAHRYRSIALAALGRSQEADKELQAARDLYAGRDPRLVARYYRTAGMTAAANVNDRFAISQLGLAVDTFARVQPASRPLAETELLRASASGARGDYAGVLPECREASRTLQLLKSGVTANLLTACLHALSLEAPKGGQPVLAEMFALSQLAQGSITSRQIALAAARLSEGSRDPKVADAIRQYDAAADRLEALYRKRLAMAAGKTNPETMAALDDDIRKAQEAQRDAGQARQEASPGFAALVQDSVSAREAQALLQPSEALAVIVLADDEGWTLLLRKDAISVGRIDGGAHRIDALVKRFRAGMDLSPGNQPAPFDAAAAGELYSAIFNPVAGGLAGVTGLTVSPSGSLLSVPFGALLTGPVPPGQDLGQAPFLIRAMAISHVPSAASFVNLRQGTKTIRAAQPWFGLGDFRPPSLRQAMATFAAGPCGDSAKELASLPPLPGARKELEVARQLLGADPGSQLLGAVFTVRKVEAAALPDYRIIHFATHAILPGELRCQTEPAVLTSTAPDAPDASGAMLTASQIELMHLDAELVILAACNTGGQNGNGAGESLSGLARSFFFAGARSLLVTHWDANDAASTYLTALFLQALQANPDAGPAAALAVSQRRMLDESVGDRAFQAHPYYWAVEALIGGRGAAGGAKVAATINRPRGG
nr:CHAT domain-containing protein [uncultured Rhodopila sp.]